MKNGKKMKTTRTLAGAALALACALGLHAPALADPAEADPALTQTVTADEASAAEGERVVIEQGHVDLGPRYADNTWSVRARDDSGQAPVWRDTDDVVFTLPDTAKLEVPEGEDYAFIAAPSAWVIPQQEIPGVPWLGWNTQDPGVVENVPATVDIVYEGHEGPGHFIAFVQAGNFKGPEILWDSQKPQSQPLSVDVNTHTHANWAFTEPGVHRVHLAFTATLKDGTPVGAKATLNFAVGADTTPASVFKAIDAAGPGADEADAMTDAEKEALDAAQSDAAPMTIGAQKDSAHAQEGESSSTLWIILGGGALAVLIVLIVAVSRRNTARAQEEALK